MVVPLHHRRDAKAARQQGGSGWSDFVHAVEMAQILPKGKAIAELMTAPHSATAKCKVILDAMVRSAAADGKPVMP